MEKIKVHDELSINDFKRRIQERDSTIPIVSKMNSQERTKLIKELQYDHQKVLMAQVQASPDEKKLWADLLSGIEQQIQKVSDSESIKYKKATQHLAPKQKVLRNTIIAFLVGGSICTIGQIIIILFQNGGLALKDAGTATSAVLIFTSALLTGLGIYDELGKFAGAGSIVPITGFANSVASSALEFKREGFIYGVGARLFTVAGPVIVYGTVMSILIGLIYFFVR